uniref:Transposase MuDR plant domain-containing protein n=1 Tax=Oryza sativa subsp. japonica TaxID=39947 RepID=Q338Y2_ORYSJ|nr:hypothetical protein LOC_Os10g23260 [Oryza sativa Japonica Group]
MAWNGAGERPDWFLDGMYSDNSFSLETRIVARNSRAQWYSLNQVVDADHTQFSGLLDDLVEKCPHEYVEPTSVALNHSAEPTNAAKSQSVELEYLGNPNPMNEHVGVDDEVEDIDDEIKDREPENMLDAFYDKKDPPMSVGTVYSYMDSFKIALASHAVKHEYNYDIEKNDTGRYRVNCAQKNDGCLRRLHASTGKDGHTI